MARDVVSFVSGSDTVVEITTQAGDKAGRKEEYTLQLDFSGCFENEPAKRALILLAARTLVISVAGRVRRNPSALAGVLKGGRKLCARWDDLDNILPAKGKIVNEPPRVDARTQIARALQELGYTQDDIDAALADYDRKQAEKAEQARVEAERIRAQEKANKDAALAALQGLTPEQAAELLRQITQGR